MLTFGLLPFTAAQQAVLADLESRGSVLDTLLLRPHQPPTDLYATCQAAALAAVEYLAAQGAERLALLPPEVPRFRIERVPGTTPIGRRISFAELLGEGYDLAQQARPIRALGNGVAHDTFPGLATALLDPPYSLRVEPTARPGSPAYTARQHQQLGELLRGYLAAVLHVAAPADAEPLVCLAWTTDWATYFEPGHEWWGAYCWTVYDPARTTIAVLLAASTD